MPHLNAPHNEYREPFLGSGAIFFTKPISRFCWLNDIDTDLIITFKVMSDPFLRKKLIEKVKEFVPSKENFNVLRDKSFDDDLDIAYRYFVLNRTSYSGIMNLPNWGFHSIKSVQPNQWPIRIEEAGKKLEGVKLTNLDFSKVILAPSTNEVLLFLDPPYFWANQKRAYLHSFKTEDHYKLLEILKATKYKFCLTYDNCKEVKEMYKWANVFEYTWRYHTANSNTSSRKMGMELIITNY